MDRILRVLASLGATGLSPKISRDFHWINGNLLPPNSFIADAMRGGWLAAANEAVLRGDKPEMGLAAVTF